MVAVTPEPTDVPVKLSRRQRKALRRQPGEDAYLYLGRTIRQTPYRHLPALMMLRNNDRAQVEAMQLYANLKMVAWTRALTFGTLVLGACTIVAALVARS